MTSTRLARRAAATAAAAALTLGGVLAVTTPAMAFTAPNGQQVALCQNSLNGLAALGCNPVAAGTSYSQAEADAAATGTTLLACNQVIPAADLTQQVIDLLQLLGINAGAISGDVGTACTPATASDFSS